MKKNIEIQKRLMTVLLTVSVALQLAACAPNDDPKSQDTNPDKSASDELTFNETKVNERVTVYTNVDTSFIRDTLGLGDELSVGTLKFSRDEQKIICCPTQGKVVVITGVDAIIDYDSNEICYESAGNYLKFNFESNEENIDPRFVVPSDASEYKLGLEGMLREYEFEGNTYFCLESDGTVRYFSMRSEQKEDYFGNNRYTTYIVEELGSGLKNDENGIIELGTSVDNALRVLLVSEKYDRLIYLSREDDLVTDDLRCVSAYDEYVFLGCYDANFTENFERDTFSRPLFFVDVGMKDNSGNALRVVHFNADGRDRKKRVTSDIDYCIPIVPGVFVVRRNFSVAVLDAVGGCLNAIMSDYGVDPDNIEIFWDGHFRTRVLVITVTANGEQDKTVYYSEKSGFIDTLPEGLIPYDEYEDEQLNGKNCIVTMDKFRKSIGGGNSNSGALPSCNGNSNCSFKYVPKEAGVSCETAAGKLNQKGHILARRR